MCGWLGKMINSMHMVHKRFLSSTRRPGRGGGKSKDENKTRLHKSRFMRMHCLRWQNRASLCHPPSPTVWSERNNTTLVMDSSDQSQLPFRPRPPRVGCASPPRNATQRNATQRNAQPEAIEIFNLSSCCFFPCFPVLHNYIYRHHHLTPLSLLTRFSSSWTCARSPELCACR